MAINRKRIFLQYISILLFLLFIKIFFFCNHIHYITLGEIDCCSQSIYLQPQVINKGNTFLKDCFPSLKYFIHIVPTKRLLQIHYNLEKLDLEILPLPIFYESLISCPKRAPPLFNYSLNFCFLMV